MSIRSQKGKHCLFWQLWAADSTLTRPGSAVEQGPFGGLGQSFVSFLFFFLTLVATGSQAKQSRSWVRPQPQRPGLLQRPMMPGTGLDPITKPAHKTPGFITHVWPSRGTGPAALDPRLPLHFRVTGMAWQQVHGVVTTCSKAPEACGGRGRICAKSGNSRSRPKQPRMTAITVDRIPPVERWSYSLWNLNGNARDTDVQNKHTVTKGEMGGRGRDELGGQVWHIHTFKLYIVVCICRFPGGSDGKESPCNAGDPPEKGMATHSTILPGKFQEPGGLQSLGSQRVGHDWVTNTTATTT